MAKTIREMTGEVREVNTALGWRDEPKSFGDCIALIHSELSEALEAFRDHRLADATGADVFVHLGGSPNDEVRRPGKPEGVGSELADVLIRVLDTADIHGPAGLGGDHELTDVEPIDDPRNRDVTSFGEFVTWMHRQVTAWGESRTQGWMTREIHAAVVLRSLVTMAERFGIDLTAEYERKIAYNRTRPYQHGGRTIADAINRT